MFKSTIELMLVVLRERSVGVLCENRVTECCTVMMSTANAMDVPPVRFNIFSHLQMKWRTPKAGVTGSNPVGRAIKSISYMISIDGKWFCTDLVRNLEFKFTPLVQRKKLLGTLLANMAFAMLSSSCIVQKK